MTTFHYPIKDRAQRLLTVEQTVPVSPALPVILAGSLCRVAILPSPSHHPLTLARGDEPRTSWARGLVGHRPSPLCCQEEQLLSREDIYKLTLRVFHWPIVIGVSQRLCTFTYSGLFSCFPLRRPLGPVLQTPEMTLISKSHSVSMKGWPLWPSAVWLQTTIWKIFILGSF